MGDWGAVEAVGMVGVAVGAGRGLAGEDSETVKVGARVVGRGVETAVDYLAKVVVELEAGLLEV